MKLLTVAFLSGTFGLASLEPADGAGILFGSWFDRLHGDTAVATNQRLAYKPLSFFQSDVNISSTLQSDFVQDIFTQIKATNSDAAVYLTIYPNLGFAAVSQSAIQDLSQRVATLTATGRKIFIRYASEMNGAWFTYGQQPTAFIKSWIQVVTSVRAAAGKDNVAFIWAPNSGNGYPYPNDTYSQTPKNTTWDATLDTNSDGLYDGKDDPYSPFYPGDQYVDWVGMSLYHYGITYPWDANVVPALGKAESILVGAGEYGPFNIYEMFSGGGSGGQPKQASLGGKPFFVTETAATLHMAVLKANNQFILPANIDPQSRANIKQAWYMQMLNATFLQKYPKVKAISFFEFIKFEETTWRDFTVLGGDGSLVSPFGNDGTSQDKVTLTTFQNDLANGIGKLIKWASVIQGSDPNPQISGSIPADNSQKSDSNTLYLSSTICILAAVLL